MTTIPISDVQPCANNERIRGLVWCSATLRHRNSDDAPHTWDTNWKWCVGVWWINTAKYGYGPTSRVSTADPQQWFVPGISDAVGVDVVRMRITHFHPLPDDAE